MRTPLSRMGLYYDGHTPWPLSSEIILRLSHAPLLHAIILRWTPPPSRLILYYDGHTHSRMRLYYDGRWWYYAMT